MLVSGADSVLIPVSARPPSVYAVLLTLPLSLSNGSCCGPVVVPLKRQPGFLELADAP